MTLRDRFFSWALAGAIFLAPLNLFFKWNESNAYVGGIFSDYLVQKFWIGEIPVLLAGVVWLWLQWRENWQHLWPFLKHNRWLVLVGCLVLVRQFFSPLPPVSWWYIWKVCELGVFAWCYRTLWPKLQHRLISAALLITLLFQIMVVSCQFFLQRPLFPYFVLGETRLASPINIARAVFQDGEKILPYGTTAHPNIAAGFIVIVGALWLIDRANRQPGGLELAVVALISWTLFLTQSGSAVLAFLLFLLFQSLLLVRRWSAYIALLIVALPVLLSRLSIASPQESVFRRSLLNEHALRVLFQHPWWGTGLGVFTTTLKNPLPAAAELVRFVQPVHHGLLLMLAETGLAGGVFVWLTVRKNFSLWIQHNAVWILLLAPLLALDHYLLTQWAGGFALVLISIFGKKFSENS